MKKCSPVLNSLPLLTDGGISQLKQTKWNIKEEDAVQMVIDNLHGPIKEAIVLGDFRTFPQLFERAARMQRSIKDGSITFLRNCSNGGEGKPKNTLRTQQPTQEVTSG